MKTRNLILSSFLFIVVSATSYAQCDSYLVRVVNYSNKTCKLTHEELKNGAMYEARYMSSQIGPSPILKPDEESIFAVAHKIFSSSGVDLSYQCGEGEVSIKTHLSYDSPIWAGTLTASVENDSSSAKGGFQLLTQPSCLNDAYAMINWNIRDLT